MALQISDTTPRVQYTATSGQTSFSVPFEFFAVADLKVYNGTTLLTYSTSPSSASQYSVTGAGVTGGGSITLGSPGATLNDVITIVRDLAIERLSDFPVSGNFPIQTLNSELDKIVAMLQQLEEQFARTLQYPVTTTTGFDVDLPELVANRVLSVNADATALLANQELGTFKGDWAASTSYQVRDLVKDTSNGNIYFVNAAHTSSGSEPLSSNTNSSKYDLIVDAASATTSATNAASSATAASTSATAAANSATAAASSETNAATSESNASTSESNASTSATNASNSATAAATSATNAATSETNAATSATAAATSATNSGNSATSAAGSATTATTQASAASTSASNAATSESNAATSASNASTSETNAATSATAASNAQTAAETAQAAAEAAADNFDDTYLGAKASDPSVDNDGDALNAGDLYFNTTSNELKYYDGSSWNAISSVDLTPYATKGFATAMSIAL
jgi:DNA polymerase III gamma/tau subunit